MLETLAKRWWMISLRGVFAIVFGFLAIAWPGVTVLALVLMWGIYTLLDGLVSVAVGIGDRSAPSEHRWTYGLLGLLGIAAGVVTLIWPSITAVALLVVIAIWAIIAGVLQLVAAVRLRKVIRHEVFLGIAGLATVVLGVLLIVQPLEGAIGLVFAIATFAIVWGLTLVLFGLRLRKLVAGTTQNPTVSV